jgi:hypothetical protein
VPSRPLPLFVDTANCPVGVLHAEPARLVTMDAEDVSIAYCLAELTYGRRAGMGKRMWDGCLSAGTDHPAAE